MASLRFCGECNNLRKLSVAAVTLKRRQLTTHDSNHQSQYTLKPTRYTRSSSMHAGIAIVGYSFGLSLCDASKRPDILFKRHSGFEETNNICVYRNELITELRLVGCSTSAKLGATETNCIVCIQRDSWCHPGYRYGSYSGKHCSILQLGERSLTWLLWIATSSNDMSAVWKWRVSSKESSAYQTEYPAHLRMTYRAVFYQDQQTKRAESKMTLFYVCT